MRILYVDVDTLRPDHTSLYGYTRNTTPWLQTLADDAVLFDHYYASDSPCVPSRAALTSGQFGASTGAIGNAGPAAQLPFTGANGRRPHEVLLGGHLYRNGMYTTSISCFPERHQAYWFTGNWREWMTPSLSLGDDQPAAGVVDVAVDWLQRHGREPNWLLHVHFWDPHTPYVVDPKCAGDAASLGPAPAWPDDAAIAEHATFYGPHTALDLYEDGGAWAVPRPTSAYPETMPDAITRRADFELLCNGYDGSIRYWDEEFGRLLGTLRSLGVYDDTAIIVSADHGECLGEHGVYGDHPMATESVHRLPMLVRWPGVTDRKGVNRRCGDLLYNIDLGPTLCEMLGLPTPDIWQGRSFAYALRGLAAPQRREYLVLSHGAYTYQRAVRTSTHLYIHTQDPGLFRLAPEQLYLVEEDPHLLTDLSETEPKLVDRCRSLLVEWLSRYAPVMDGLGDPMQRRLREGPEDAFPVGGYARRLVETGRADLAEDLMRRRRHWPTVARR